MNLPIFVKSLLLLLSLAGTAGFLASCGPAPKSPEWDKAYNLEPNFSHPNNKETVKNLLKNLAKFKQYKLGYNQNKELLFFYLGIKKQKDGKYVLVLLAPELKNDPKIFLFAQGPEPKIPTEQLKNSEVQDKKQNNLPIFKKLAEYQEVNLADEDDRVLAETQFYEKIAKLANKLAQKTKETPKQEKPATQLEPEPTEPPTPEPPPPPPAPPIKQPETKQPIIPAKAPPGVSSKTKKQKKKGTTRPIQGILGDIQGFEKSKLKKPDSKQKDSSSPDPGSLPSGLFEKIKNIKKTD